jgi:hypothetical protein
VLEMSVREIEMPSEDKIAHLSTFLSNFYTSNVMSSKRLTHCYAVYNEFRSKFLADYPDASVNMYGSVAYGVCFNDSPCDISVEFNSENRTNDEVLAQVGEFIRTRMADRFVVDTPQNSVKSSPKLTGKKAKAAGSGSMNKLLLETKGSLKTYFNFTSGVMAESYKTSMLLRAYMELDERVKIIALCFRHMARVNIDHFSVVSKQIFS